MMSKPSSRTILDRGVAEADPAKRAEIYKEANQLYYDLAVGIPLGCRHQPRLRTALG